MPKAKVVPPQKSRSIIRWLRWPAALVLLAVIAGAVIFVAYVWRHSHTERGQYNISDTYLGENLEHSLDLNVADKASYPSAPLKFVQDLGQVGGYHSQVFNFPVKDDNLSEYGLAVWPTTPKPAHGYPVIILLHGYVNPARYLTEQYYISDMDFYASHGFLVVKPDLRGQGLSLHDGTPDSVYYSMSYNTDTMSLISALKDSPFVDKSNINLWGHSMGAYIALRAGVLSKDIRNIILLSGPVDTMEEMYLTYIPPSDENNPYAVATRNEVFAKYGTPPDNPRFWSDASPINFVWRIKGQVQIHAGGVDGLIPYRFSEDLSNALAKAHVRHQLYIYPGGDHGLGPQRPLIHSRSLQLLTGSQS